MVDTDMKQTEYHHIDPRPFPIHQFLKGAEMNGQNLDELNSSQEEHVLVETSEHLILFIERLKNSKLL